MTQLGQNDVHDPPVLNGRTLLVRHAGLAVVAVLALHALLLAWAACRNSVTFDEFAHLPAGLAYWKHGAFGIYNLSPPLLRLWAAVPCLALDVQTPDTAPFNNLAPGARHWMYGERFMHANFDRYADLFLWARLGMIPLSCLGGWIVYLWGRALHGAIGGLAACGLYAVCPNIAAHGSLVTTDVGTTTAILASCWLWWRFSRRPGMGRAILAGLAIGAAHLCKFSAVLLWPAMLAMSICFELGDKEKKTPMRIWGFVIAGAITLLMINAMYGFRGSCARISSYNFGSRALAPLNGAPGWIRVPLPRDFVEGFDAQKAESEMDWSAFILGDVYRGNRWFYYPVTLALKLPICTLVLMLLWVLVMIGRRRAEAVRWFDGTTPILISTGVFGFGMAVLSQLNIGVRYVLPILPFLHLWLAGLWSDRAGRGRATWAVIAATALLAGAAAENLSVAPRYLSFINLAAGGPTQGWRLLSDSNFDWGQGLLDLRDWMRRNDVKRVKLAYFATVDPGVYGINYTPITQPGAESYVAVSSFFLSGLPHYLRTPTERSTPFELACHRELARKSPVAVAGYTIFIYSADDFEAAEREHGLTQRGPATAPKSP